MNSILPWGGGGVQCRVSERIPAFPVSLSLEGVSQMAYILPERLLALVRPAFDLSCEGFEV